MNAAHTPGPWKARAIDSYGVLRVYTAAKGSQLVATPGHRNSRDEEDANARLIAAAPELLEACLLFARWAQAEQDFRYPPGSLQQVTAAIAKATGGAA